MYNLWKITPFLSKIDSKRSPGRSFHGHNLHPRVTGLVQACSFLFFPSMIFLKGIICTPNLCNEKMWATVLVQMLRIILPLELVNLLNNCAHAYSPD